MKTVELPTKRVVELTEVTTRELGGWIKSGLLRPSVADGSGRGHRRLFSFQDVVAIKTVKELRSGGCPLQEIKLAVAYLKAHYPEQSSSEFLSQLTLLTDGSTVLISNRSREVMEVVSQQRVWNVPLGKLIQDANSDLDALPLDWQETVEVASRTLHLVITREPGATSFVATCRELPGLLVTGISFEAAKASAIERVAELAQLRPASQRATASHAPKERRGRHSKAG